MAPVSLVLDSSLVRYISLLSVTGTWHVVKDIVRGVVVSREPAVGVCQEQVKRMTPEQKKNEFICTVNYFSLASFELKYFS